MVNQELYLLALPMLYDLLQDFISTFLHLQNAIKMFS